MQSETATPLGMIAGGGALPRRLIAACRGSGRPVYVVALNGQTDEETVADVPHAWFRIGAGGAILDALKASGAREVVLAGRVRRPSIRELRPDARTAAIMLKAMMQGLGDDALLKLVSAEMARDGLAIVAPDSIIAELRAPLGVWGAHAPDEQALADIARGVAVLAALAPVDVGQAVAVQQGIVLAVEAIEGTDAMIARAGAVKREGAGPTLVKLPKSGQSDRLDQPTVGPDTVTAAIAAGFAGIAVGAGGTLALDRAAMVAAADAAGLFLTGIAS